MSTTNSKVTAAKARFTNFSRRIRHNEKPPKLSPDMQRRGEASRAAAANGHAAAPFDTPSTTTTTTTGPAAAAAAAAPPVNGVSATNGTIANTTLPPSGAGSEIPSSGSDSSAYQIRPPAHHRSTGSLHHRSADFQLPDLPWLCGTWHVTHSTLPMWRGKRNVRITYTRLPGDKLEDLVTYQEAGSTNLKRVMGIDSPKSDGSYLWRGKGWLKIASSHWEVLGWGGGGRHTGAGAQSAEGLDSEQWVVTYFQKTMFTPAGVDIYSRSPAGLSERTLAKVMKALQQVDRAEAGKASGFGKLVGEIFPVTVDEARTVRE